MNRSYTLAGGEKLYTFYSNYGNLTIYRKNQTTGRLEEDVVLTYDTNSEDPCVEYHRETIHLNDFDYMPYEELLARINKGIEDKDDRGVQDWEILSTFMKETDKVAIEMEVQTYDMIMPELGLAFKSDSNWGITLVVPFECDMYKRDDWSYKMSLIPFFDELKPLIGKETTYSSDIFSGLRRGVHWKLVDKEQWIKDHPEKFYPLNEAPWKTRYRKDQERTAKTSLFSQEEEKNK